jgi:branched-chain amino acid transport system substrate-binding protein
LAVIDSLRGKWTMSTSHNPVQNNDLREASNKENKLIGIAPKRWPIQAGCRI